MTRPLPASTSTYSLHLPLPALAALLAAASLAAPPCRAADDDAAVANRKWVRAQLARLEDRLNPDTNAVLSVCDETSVSYSATIPLGGGTNLIAEITTPTNAGLFVAWSAVPDLIPTHSFYAKAPGVQAYANVSNAYLREIRYSVSNWTETAWRDGVLDSCGHARTTWTATASDGSAWRSAAWDGNTVLYLATNPAVYAVIQRTAITDAKRDALLAGYGASVAAQAPPHSAARLLALLGSRLLDLAVPSANADAAGGIPVVEGDGRDYGCTLGFHSGVQIGFEVTVTAPQKGTYVVTQGGDHQYNPYSGTDHKDLAADEADYLSEAMFSNPSNWGYSFPMEFKSEEGVTFTVTLKQFKNSPEWQDFVAGVKLPSANYYDEPEISEPTDHEECGVYELIEGEDGSVTRGRHVGCTCPFYLCPYYEGAAEKGLTEYKYKSKKAWKETGVVEWVEKTLKYKGALHNWQVVATGYAEDGSGMTSWKDAELGCLICFKDEDDKDTHFCGNGNKGNIDSKLETKHYANVYSVTRRPECGCLCRKRWADENGKFSPDGLPQTDQHVPYCDPQTGDFLYNVQQLSKCWCWCLRNHSGTDFGDRDDKTHCPGQCKTCGCYKTYDGESMANRVTSEPMEYRVTDSGTVRKEDLDSHVPMEDGYCGCKCGAVSPDGGPFKDLMWNDERWHVKESEDAASCTCVCPRKLHTVYKAEGNEDCKNVCDLCGCVNDNDAQGNAVARAAVATDHTPHAEYCGCQCYVSGVGHVPAGFDHCGFSGQECAELPDFHNRMAAGSCACRCGTYANHAANGGGHKDWFLPSPCQRICAATDAQGAKCGLLVDGTAAQVDDHTPKDDDQCGCYCGEMDEHPTAMGFHHGTGAIPCLCQCGKCHLHAAIDADKCQVCRGCGLALDLSVPLEESLHVLNPESPSTGYFYGTDNPDGTNGVASSSVEMKCACFCGYYADGTHEAKGKRLHKFTGTRTDSASGDEIENCTCDCGRSHDYREWTKAQKGARSQDDTLCPVCAYCRKVTRTGTGDDAKESEASLADHLARDRALADGKDGARTKCGCRCGLASIDVEQGTLAKFHPRYPGSCRCWGGSGDGRGAWHYLDPDLYCSKLCRFRDEDGKRHLVSTATTSSVPALGNFGEAGEEYHTPKTAGDCGCLCGDFTAANVTPSGPLHVQDPLWCGCYCRQAPMKRDDHRFPAGSCSCYCGGYHNSNYMRTDCVNVCAQCGLARSEGSSGKKFDVSSGFVWKDAKNTDHTPKPDGCGCACGKFAASAYSASADGEADYHNGTGSAYSCRCECGASHRGFAASACPKVCSVCKYTREFQQGFDYHTQKTDGCGCLCGEYAENHRHASNKCVCYCDVKQTWPHDTRLVSGPSPTGETYTCGTCGNEITKTVTVYQCARCGETSEQPGEDGHGSACTAATPSAPVCSGCMCSDDCASCQGLSGYCAGCKKLCGQEATRTGEGETDGGDAGDGGAGELDNI